jgi:hypothetical protein
MSTSIGAETSIKIIAAVHSQCRRWVNHCISIEPQSRPLSVVAPIADKRGQTRWCLVCLQSARSRLHRLDRNATKKLAHLARRRSRVHAPTTFRLNECPSRPRNEVKRWLKRQALGFGFCILFWNLFGKCVGRERKILAECHRITRPYRLVPDPFSEFGLNQIGNTRPMRSFRRTPSHRNRRFL